MPEFITVTMYVHGSKEQAHDLGQKRGLTGEALRLFAFAASEVKLTMRVNKDRGHAYITHVDDREVSDVTTKS